MNHETETVEKNIPGLDHNCDLKYRGLVGVTLKVSRPSSKEVELANRLLAPLRERLGLEPYPVPKIPMK